MWSSRPAYRRWPWEKAQKYGLWYSSSSSSSSNNCCSSIFSNSISLSIVISSNCRMLVMYLLNIGILISGVKYLVNILSVHELLKLFCCLYIVLWIKWRQMVIRCAAAPPYQSMRSSDKSAAIKGEDMIALFNLTEQWEGRVKRCNNRSDIPNL